MILFSLYEHWGPVLDHVLPHRADPLPSSATWVLQRGAELQTASGSPGPMGGTVHFKPSE